jgi:hypothetical protein
MWEGQLCLAVKDGNLRFLFKNKGNLYLYNNCRFEMPAALTQHCPPDSVANAFTSLLLLCNSVQGNNELILQYWSCFDGIIMELFWCTNLPGNAVPARYQPSLLRLAGTLCTCFKSIETATIDLIVSNIKYHDRFAIHECKDTKPPASASCMPAAASANTDKKSTVWNSPFKWLSKSYS